MTGAYSGISATVTHFITNDSIDYAPERSRHAHIAAYPASSQIPSSEILLPPLHWVNLQTSAREYALEAARMGYIVANPLFQTGVGHAHRHLNMPRGKSMGRPLQKVPMRRFLRPTFLSVNDFAKTNIIVALAFRRIFIDFPEKVIEAAGILPF